MSNTPVGTLKKAAHSSGEVVGLVEFNTLNDRDDFVSDCVKSAARTTGFWAEKAKHGLQAIVHAPETDAMKNLRDQALVDALIDSLKGYVR